MICNIKELLTCLKIEKSMYIGTGKKAFVNCLMQTEDFLLWKYVRSLRISEFCYNAGNNVGYLCFQKKKNCLGRKLGISIWRNNADVGLRIWHWGNIIINGNVKIGKNCQLHGMNCIGNKGGDKEGAPVLGDNVDVGVGATIIGDVYIANNVKIGANAVVTKSCYEEGATLVGIPAEVKK